MKKKVFALLLIGWVVFLSSCEDGGISKGDKNFISSGLRTIYVDTFNIATSTVLADSLPTSGTNILLIGAYNDNLVGSVSSSTYLQIAYQSTFLPDATSIYDSIALILPYNRYSYGDTTKSFTLNVHELTQTIKLRTFPPFVARDKASSLIQNNALYNTSSFSYNSTPLASHTFQFYPHRDSIYIPMPKSLGQEWYGIAKADSSFHFKDPNRFLSEYFKGIYIAAAAGTDAGIIGFKANKSKIRLYYRKIVGDNLANTFFDFPMVNGFNQFNNIKSDRSSTPLASLLGSDNLSSNATNNISYVQSGAGLFTKIEFPTLKQFLKNKNYVIVDALLEVPLVQQTYVSNNSPPPFLSLYATDQSNILLGGISSGNGTLSSSVFYDREYGLETKYSFSVVNYIFSELKSDAPSVTPLALISPTISSQVNRVAIGNRLNPTNKIKLKIFYTQYDPNK